MRYDRLYMKSVARSLKERIDLAKLDLTGLTVLTEAATGAYAVAPVIAAMAGAREVVAYTKDSQFGKSEDVLNETNQLIHAIGKPLPVTIINKISPVEYSRFDIITNSGHLRPITREHIMFMKPTAVIPLMYESWELRKSDVDLMACRDRGIRTAGTNEHNRLLNVFEFLGPLVVKALHNGFIPMIGSRIVVISNNAFGLPIARHLVRNLAEIFCVGPKECFYGIDDAVLCGDLGEAEITQNIDVCVIATTPSISHEQTYNRHTLTEFISNVCPATCVHMWGDIEYEILQRLDVLMMPSEQPHEGHQGLVMSGIGPEPIIRLIVGGLKVGEVLYKNSVNPFDLEFCQMLL